MRQTLSGIRLSATDLSNHLACAHVTTLDIQLAQGARPEPQFSSPDAQTLRELGDRHEAAYLAHMEREENLTVVNLKHITDPAQRMAETLALMARGAQVIAQGALASGNWIGYPDVLRRVETPAKAWPWSYEVADTKLTMETKGGAILQLLLYSLLLTEAQQHQPEHLWVVPPGNNFQGERYRIAEYEAYFRQVKQRLQQIVAAAESGTAVAATYPEPVEHCAVCRWFQHCDQQRRDDDHLSLVAGIRRQQRDQLEEWNTHTMAKLATLPLPIPQKPAHGSRQGLERVREQARVQVQGRTEKRLIHETLPDIADGAGFRRLPQPSSHDMFFDLEGDPFAAPEGLQYLFGFACRAAAGEKLAYECRWALNRVEEKLGFEWVVDEIMARRRADSAMHVYHFGAYEPSTLKRLMGLHATREDEVDRILRAGVLVDLHQAFKQSTRASVEEYSLKKIEAFYKFKRETPLDKSRAAMRLIEHGLELGWGDRELPDQTRADMQNYNREDCLSTAQLRDWLETQRAQAEAKGAAVPRFVDRSEDPTEELDARQQKVLDLVTRLTAGISTDPKERGNEQKALWLLAQLLDWHRREDKAAYAEKYRFAELDEQQLLDDKAGVAGLKFVERLGVENKIPVDRYTFEKQETEVRAGDDLYCKLAKFGSVKNVDVAARTIDVKKTKKTADLDPTAVFVWDAPPGSDKQADSLCRIAQWVIEKGIDASGKYRAGRDLLLRTPPRLNAKQGLDQAASETPDGAACRIVLALKDSTFAIQGPPGSGKTYTGAEMICTLVGEGKKVGVTAQSHKVIRKLLKDVVTAAHKRGQAGVSCMHLNKYDDGSEDDGVAAAKDDKKALAALDVGDVTVLGGTTWLWSPQDSASTVDVLFIDEAGQMSLANVLAVSQAATKLVLLGDPQQLEQPLKGSHPEGAEKSALEHLLNGAKIIPPHMGFLLPETWRLHPNICSFTSELFYDGKLSAKEHTRSRVIEGHSWLNGAGLWYVRVEHDGNSNSSAEEVNAIQKIVNSLLQPKINWFYGAGNKRKLTRDDILIVAPYNAQVADLSERLPNMRIGTVDKFQGQEAPVVIYSLATSSPEDAPRGMEFLYSLNRLNVATSRAQSCVIVVGSPSLFEPNCRTPHQMKLANALCAYQEQAHTINP